VTGPRYELRFRPAALRQLRKLDSQIARRIKSTTETLRTEPRPPGVKALTGQHGWLRIRVGDYRIVYEVRDSELVVLVIQIGHRSKIYGRWPADPLHAIYWRMARALTAATPAMLARSQWPTG
jgi:mRNA interferase RelE/StbE